MSTTGVGFRLRALFEPGLPTWQFSNDKATSGAFSSVPIG
jgi:hypothetical protein